jgi:hypothetical protein
MGHTTALDLAGQIHLDQGLAYHLTGNHYPPVPLAMVDPCKAAIDAFLDEDWDREIELPDPITYKGRTTAPARAIVEQHHLEPFIDTLQE